MFYDARFGRMKVAENGETADQAVSNGSSSGIVSNANGNGNLHAKRTSDKAIYEQFQSQVPCLMDTIKFPSEVAFSTPSNFTDLCLVTRQFFCVSGTESNAHQWFFIKQYR